MAVSQRYKCIFVHIPKTAGTSIEAALGMHGALDFIGKRAYENQEKDYETFFGDGLQHLTATQLRDHPALPLSFDAAFRFTFVRNPWDRMISALAYNGGVAEASRPKDETHFNVGIRDMHVRFCKGALFRQRRYMPQVRYIHDEDGRPLVDFIGRFESLQDDWRTVQQHTGCENPLEHRMRSARGAYAQHYTDETRDMVAEIYAEDIAALGYSFDGGT